MSSISAEDFATKLMGTVKTIDCRETEELEIGKVEGSIHIPTSEFEKHGMAMITLPKVETYYIYCGVGVRSHMMVTEFNNNGYRAVNIDGGMLELSQFMK